MHVQRMVLQRVVLQGTVLQGTETKIWHKTGKSF